MIEFQSPMGYWKTMGTYAAKEWSWSNKQILKVFRWFAVGEDGLMYSLDTTWTSMLIALRGKWFVLWTITTAIISSLSLIIYVEMQKVERLMNENKEEEKTDKKAQVSEAFWVCEEPQKVMFQ